jgi:Mn2+/Fe2+ NRAMP family transporter
MKSSSKFLNAFGPGLLYAGAAIGVSHLVQSTRAGADFGYELLWAIILVNVLKYPFFEIATRYTVKNEKSILEAYREIGNWALFVFFIFTFFTMFIIISAVSTVTAGLFLQILPSTFVSIFANLYPGPLWWICALILTSSTILLMLGNYAFLDKLMKWIVIGLTISTFVALAVSLTGQFEKKEEFARSFDFFKEVDIKFFIALLGWMPIPIEASVWQSDWILAKKEQNGKMPDYPSASLDFQVGYWGTTILAVCFLSLGAIVMYSSGNQFQEGAVAFSKQLIDLYTLTLGSWAYPIIAICAFFTMFSTSITCLDAYPRVCSRTIKMVMPKWSDLYRPILILLSFGTLVILFYFQKSMREIVDFATTVSFLLAPILATINYKVMNIKFLDKEIVPSPGYLWIARLGLVFLYGFSIYYVYLNYFK